MDNKTKQTIIVFLLIIAIGLGLFLIINKLNKSKKPANSPVTTQKVSYEMTGEIKAVKSGLIAITGTVNSTNGAGQEKKTIIFKVNANTILKSSTVVITAAQMKSGKPFHPETKIIAGKISDLVAGLEIMKIKSQENLFASSQPTAAEIDYLKYDYPPLPLH